MLTNRHNVALVTLPRMVRMLRLLRVADARRFVISSHLSVRRTIVRLMVTIVVLMGDMLVFVLPNTNSGNYRRWNPLATAKAPRSPLILLFALVTGHTKRRVVWKNWR